MAHITLGITGSIAAYKAADLASILVKQGHEVHCVCTAKALEFVTPLTLHTISRNPVIASFEDETQNWVPSHIEYAQQTDILVIAPATANTIAQLTYGLAPDILSSLYLACEAPVLICPAMNEKMWLHEATQANIQTLSQRARHTIFGPDESGILACGDQGKGKLMPVSEIANKIAEILSE